MLQADQWVRDPMGNAGRVLVVVNPDEVLVEVNGKVISYPPRLLLPIVSPPPVA